MQQEKRLLKIKVLRNVVFLVASFVLYSCIHYKYVSLNITKPGDLTESLQKVSSQVTDIKISGKLNNQDIQNIIELATSSDLLTRLDLSDCDGFFPDHAFAGCIYLQAVSLPYNMDKIPNHMFSGCTNLSEVTIPQSCICIEEEAFSNCSSLKTLFIPSETDIIKHNAFKNCDKIKSITCASPTPPTCDYSTFTDLPNNCVLTVPKGSLSQYKNAIGWERFISIEEVKNLKTQKDTNWRKY